jgi:hypothetical protein
MDLRSVRFRAGTLLLASLLTISSATTAFATGSPPPPAPTYSGQATVARAQVLDVPVTVVDTGPLPSSGGAREAALLSTAVPGLLTGDVLHATTIAQGNASRSEASIANLKLTVAGNDIGATLVLARAAATCGTGGAAVAGGSEIVGLVINGKPIVVTGQPNQTIALPNLASIVLNEQISRRMGDLTVNAIHVSALGVADVVVAAAHADITCSTSGAPDCTGGDFVTGGGWIETAGMNRGTFAVAGGLKNGALWGHLQYIDHGTGLKVKGTGVTAYTTTSATTRRIEGTAEIGGKPGTYKIDVADNGEPGRYDTFSIKLSTGYAAAGKLAGGNIQLHKPC